VVSDYPDKIAQAGWELIHRRTRPGFDQVSGRPLRIDCYIFRTRVWGLDETLGLAILNWQSFRMRSGATMEFCAENGQIG
jgi:hypothetical protein